MKYSFLIILKLLLEDTCWTRKFQVTVLRGLKDLLRDSLLSWLESALSLSTFYLTCYSSGNPSSCLALFPQSSHSPPMIRDEKNRKGVTRNVTERWQVHWHEGKFLGLIWRAAGSGITLWISWGNSASWHFHKPEYLFYQVRCFSEALFIYRDSEGSCEGRGQDIPGTSPGPLDFPWTQTPVLGEISSGAL